MACRYLVLTGKPALESASHELDVPSALESGSVKISLDQETSAGYEKSPGLLGSVVAWLGSWFGGSSPSQAPRGA
jgi:hypothetical protein